jgi:hypothetical protein
MQFSSRSITGAAVVAVFIAVLCRLAPGQDTPAREVRGVPPRATPAEYQAHAQAGSVTIAAEFTRHSIATLEGTLSTEDYVVVEVGLFGPPEARLKLSHDDFSLRINDKKVPLPSLPYGVVYRSLKDPEWAPPEPPASKSSKTSIGSGGGGGGQNDPGSTPPVVHVPIEIERGWQQRVQKSALPEGDRQLPEAGLIFFSYRNKPSSIHSIELTYAGAAGKATLTLQP